MSISNIGHSILHTQNKNLHLKNILHVPTASKNLVSVHHLASDNNAYLEFHPNFFFIKDRATKQTLHQGRCQGGLYPLAAHPPRSSSPKQMLGINKPSTSRWHSRLGHPSFPIVKQVVSTNNLPCVSNKEIQSICDSCQRDKVINFPILNLLVFLVLLLS